MNEDLQDKVIEDEEYLEVVFTNEMNASTCTLSFHMDREGAFIFTGFIKSRGHPIWEPGIKLSSNLRKP